MWYLLLLLAGITLGQSASAWDDHREAEPDKYKQENPGVDFFQLLDAQDYFTSESVLGALDTLPVGRDGTPLSNLQYKYPASQRVTIDGRKFGQCLAIATQQTTKDYYLNRNEMNGAFSVPGFLFYLQASHGQSGRYHSGYEEQLKSWMLKQPDDSIDPVGLYTEALKLNKGNVWNALLTCHDLLRNNARFYDTERYRYSTHRRYAETLFNKLIDIRGDLKERNSKERTNSFSGDHGGTWYRLWAFLIFALAQERDRNPGERQNKKVCNCELAGPIAKLRYDASEISRYLIIGTEANLAALTEASKKLWGRESDAVGKLRTDFSSAESIMTFSSELWDNSAASSLEIDPKKKNSLECQKRNYLVPFSSKGL